MLNPYRKSSHNLTQQWALEKEQPALAAELKAQAEAEAQAAEQAAKATPVHQQWYNPWLPHSWNLTDQMQVTSENPVRAEYLAREAGRPWIPPSPHTAPRREEYR